MLAVKTAAAAVKGRSKASISGVASARTARSSAGSGRIQMDSRAGM